MRVCPIEHDHDVEPCPTDNVQPCRDDDYFRYVDQRKHVHYVDGERLVQYSGTAIPINRTA